MRKKFLKLSTGAWNHNMQKQTVAIARRFNRNLITVCVCSSYTASTQTQRLRNFNNETTKVRSNICNVRLKCYLAKYKFSVTKVPIKTKKFALKQWHAPKSVSRDM